jgi:glucosamine--fructose-6-phosphate aminotransferase (isomerizing)
MCGIVGYIGSQPVAPIILNGLSALEYRGYDSSGLATLSPLGDIHIVKEPGNIASLVASTKAQLLPGTTGIGHTRWATHGSPTRENAHPHTDCLEQIAVVHNGILENFIALRTDLRAKGHIFKSQTDSEVIAHMLEQFLADGLPWDAAIQNTAAAIKGASAIVVLNNQYPDSVTAFRLGNAGGLTIGYGKNESFVASDLPAILPHTRKVSFLDPGEIAFISHKRVLYTSIEGQRITKRRTLLSYDPVSISKQGYPTFMLKEIFEQPEAVLNTIRGRVSFDDSAVKLDGFPFSQREVKSWRRIVLVGMGTSFHACLLGRMILESLVGIPAEADNAAEFRYRDPLVDSSTLVISIAQSGETVDTLAAMEEAKGKGCPQITICNNPEAQTTRLADYTFYMNAGPEVGVASSKTFTCSLVSLYILALHLGTLRGHIAKSRRKDLIADLAHLPDLMGSTLTNNQPCRTIADLYYEKEHFLYIGRNATYPLSLEGALKLKELAYVHAEGTTAAEMKHGPIALIDDRIPVIALIPNDRLYEKTLGNIAELKARNATVIALTTEPSPLLANQVNHVLTIPASSEFILPILAAIPLQLLAYHIASKRGCNVDQPRNLAKTVTVE